MDGWTDGRMDVWMDYNRPGIRRIAGARARPPFLSSLLFPLTSRRVDSETNYENARTLTDSSACTPRAFRVYRVESLN